jgi:6-phosphogluconate dehydrogenase
MLFIPLLSADIGLIGLAVMGQVSFEVVSSLIERY